MLSAVIVGVWTAWYLGLRAGALAAAAVAVALVIAQVIPGATITIYALVIAWCAALYFIAPKLVGKVGSSSGNSFRTSAATTWLWLKKTLQR